MSTLRSAALTVILSGIVALSVLPFLLVRAPASVASLALGTEEAFSTSGLEPRENQVGGGALRWMGRQATFRFDGVRPGLVDLAVSVRDHRKEVTVSANGARVGTLLPGQPELSTRIRLSGNSLVIGFETEGFGVPGRTLGTQIVSLRVAPTPPLDLGPGGVASRLWIALFSVVLMAAFARVQLGLGVAAALAAPAAFLLLVLPAGLWRSEWLVQCAAVVAVATIVSALVSFRARGSAFARVWLQVAMLAALLIHGLLPPSPLVIQGDAQLHGNKLKEVASGNLFPTSRTDHRPPFEIPYGFSFYGLLAPCLSLGVPSVTLVREGAAFFSALSAVALALFLGRSSAGLAAVSLLLWTFAPLNIRTMAFGNLSNVFAQSIFVLFLIGAAVMRKGLFRSLCLTLLVALSATAHLSSFIVLLALLFVTFLVRSDRRAAGQRALVAGVLIAVLYYASFLPMILAQLPRLLGERGGSAGLFDPWRLPNQLLQGAGWPLLGLVALTVLVAGFRPFLPFAKSQVLSALLLALAALVSPVEVRYLLALVPLLAIVGASRFDQMEPGAPHRQSLSALVDFPSLRALGRERIASPLTLGLIGAAVVSGTLVLLDFIPVYTR